MGARLTDRDRRSTQVLRGDRPGQVVTDDGDDRPEGDALQRERVGDVQAGVADRDDDARSDGHEVDRVGEVDPVLQPDLRPEQADHAVEHHRDPAEDTARNRGDERTELRAEPEQDRHAGGDVVGGGGVDPGRGHHADVLGVRRGRGAADRRGDHGGEAVGADRAAHHRVQVMSGHRGHRLDVPCVLRDQGDHRRQDEQHEGEVEGRQVPPHDLHPVRPDHGRRREADPVGGGDGLEVRPEAGGNVPGRRVVGRDLAEGTVEGPREHVADHQPEEDRDPAEEPAQPDRQRDHGGHDDQGDPLILRPVDVGDDRGEVEPDEHDHRSRHHRREHAVDRRRAEQVDHHADQREHCAGDEDRAGDVGRGPALRADRDDPADEGRRGPEVARHPPLDDQQEDDRGDARHHDRELGVEPHQQREDECRAEHRDDVLGAEARGLAPREPLVGHHHLAWRERPALVVQLPSDGHCFSSQRPPV